MADKYLDLSGLQAFYNELTGKYTTAFPTTTTDPAGKYPMQTSAIGAALAGITNSAASGWSAWSAVTANSATWATDTNTIAGMTDVATYFDGVSANKAKSATSATNAAKAASATKANSAGKLSAAQNIASNGDVSWTVSFDGSTGVTGAATINSVPASAISSVPWSAIDDYAAAVDASTTNKFVTPKAVNDAITAAMTNKAAFKGPYATTTAIPTADYDKLSIFLVGPIGTGTDKYEEYVWTGTTPSTATLLLIGDTSTDLSDYETTAAFNTWVTSTNSLFSGTSRSAKSATSAGTAAAADDASKLGGIAAANVTGSAAKGAAASAWITAHSGDYASVEHDHNYKISANTTAFDVSSNVRFSAGNNIALTSAGVGVIGISGATIGNATISIATGASPATGTFTVNATSNKTITLGSMALAQTSSYMATGSMVPYTSAEVTGGISW